MGELTYLFKTIIETSPQAVAEKIQHYTKIGYYIQGGMIHSHNKLKSIFPFRMEVEYTVIMQKPVKGPVSPSKKEKDHKKGFCP